MAEEARQIASQAGIPDECPAEDTAADRDRWYPKAAAHYRDVAHWLRGAPQDAPTKSAAGVAAFPPRRSRKTEYLAYVDLINKITTLEETVAVLPITVRDI